MFRHTFLYILYFLICISSNAQVVGNNGDTKATLELFSDLERDNLKDVAEGHIILNTSTNCINYFSKGKWYSLCGGCLPPTPEVKVDSFMFKAGQLFVFFNEEQAISNKVKYFNLTIQPMGWEFTTEHSPFKRALEVDSVYATILLSAVGECGEGTKQPFDSILLYTYHPCEGKSGIVDSRDNTYYELVEIAGECWIKGYLKFIPSNGNEYINKNDLIYYNGSSIFSTSSNFCPSGFHIPSLDEANNLADRIDDPYNQYTVTESYDKRLKDFGVEFKGVFDMKKNNFFNGSSDFFWVKELKDKQECFLGLLTSKAMMVSGAPKNSYVPIRCIKD